MDVLLESEVQLARGLRRQLHGHRGDRSGATTASVSQFKVGNVIVATGYKEFDASRVTHYGYGKLPNVITSFEFEKMLRAGRIQTKEGKMPQYVAIIHCVGSRSKEFHTYCSRVCCMTALKYAQRSQVRHPGVLRQRHLHRHARVRQGPRGLLPARLGGEDPLPDVRQERPPGHPQGGSQRRLRHAHRGEREAVRRGHRDPGRPGDPHGGHGGPRRLGRRSLAW